MLAARQRQAAAAPAASRASGARVKVGNLTPGISTVNLKDALQRWGIMGISHIEKPQGSFGKEAVVHFKKEADAELMLQASGIQVEGRACTVTPMAKVEKASKVDAGSAGSQGGPLAAAETNLMKVVGMKSGSEQQDLITFLRGRGVLGIVEVVARGSTGLVRFQQAEHVKAAVMKADGGIMGREKHKLSLQPIDQAEWLRVLTEQVPLEPRRPRSARRPDMAVIIS
ncbi:unnamed protein product [Prorocentrum cordatum]|uniref:RRM domain-containing protein n=1 Tax=Prorocentrum cordatum TaxID=2364126 RepID=A0ABN9RFN8_9DINO|nr:unnamed protein product [Polarella glacialis]